MTKIHYKKLESVPKWFKHSKLVWGLSELISHLRNEDWPKFMGGWAIYKLVIYTLVGGGYKLQKSRVTKGTHVKWFYEHKGQRRYIIWNTGVRQDTIVMFDSDMCDRRQRTGNRWNR
ncbi:uncharacterized protein EV154DRAFT_487001 [Mucor mucedo]|uniref:uncharacterized protein n=1 Tax=Mucor mucedo TaxID=29922 RepID=UPI00221F0EEC|nr:uncharacterized protein EV154DRAFT_487001 [Mucor mucedo]KAI7874004.1 hypothetical protein EV154DRAFT_487001 [Mucor mucedo]